MIMGLIQLKCHLGRFVFFIFYASNRLEVGGLGGSLESSLNESTWQANVSCVYEQSACSTQNWLSGKHCRNRVVYFYKPIYNLSHYLIIILPTLSVQFEQGIEASIDQCNL